MIDEYSRIENARVERVNVGSAIHDGRGFFTVYFAGQSWGQGIHPKFDPETIDKIIAICDAPDLFGCIGRLVRVGYDGPLRGSATLIAAVAHALDDTKVLRLRA